MYKKATVFYAPIMVCAAAMLAACSGGWLGGDDDAPLPGKRYAVLPEASIIREDSQLRNDPVKLGSPRSQERWTQVGGGSYHYVPHPKGPDFTRSPEDDSARAGDGNGWEMSLVPGPVVAGERVFAMDAAGIISAHAVEDIDKEFWQAGDDADDDSSLPGGGLAYARGALVAATGAGTVTAYDAKDGSLMWQRELGMPLRSSPTIAADRAYVITVDNQMFVLSLEDGRLLWKHQGISEKAGVMASTSVAVEGSMVVVPYSSGEIYALMAENGKEVWRDTITGGVRTAGAARLVDISTPPIISRQLVFAASRGGVLVALDKNSGLRVWEQEFAGVKGIWLSMDYLFVLTGDNQLVTLLSGSGRVRWAKPVIQEDDDTEEAYWFGPMLVSDKLVLLGSEGHLAVFSPQTGVREHVYDIADGIVHMPAIANDRMFFVTRDATLYSLR